MRDDRAKRPQKPPVKQLTGVVLYPSDKANIETIQKAHGLIRVSDCIRFALQETAKRITA